MKLWSFRRSRAHEDAERLLAAVTAASRQPGFYGEGKAPDTIQGRFELVTLHGALALIRIQREPELAPLGQHFADVLFRHFDAGLREAGVGDMAVPRRMRKIASAFYGRLEAYSQALKADDRAALSAALARNVLEALDAPFAGPLAAYVAQIAAHQAEAPVESLFQPEGWPPAPA